MLKVAVGTPWSSPFMYTAYVDSVLNLRRPEDCELRFFRGRGWCPARRHNHLCEQALAWGADIVIIVGPDQVYEPDLLERLLARHREGYTFVAAMVPTRGVLPGNDVMRPFQPLAWKNTPKGLELIEKDGAIQQASVIGTGVLLFEANRLNLLSRPWFSESIHSLTWDRTVNQDATFVYRLQEDTGARLWVDTSIEVKHLHIFEIDDSYQQRFADWAESTEGSKT